VASGYLAYAGVLSVEPVWRILLVGLLIGAIVGGVAATLVAATTAEQFLPTVTLFGLILGGLAGLITSIGVIALSGIVPWYIVTVILGILVGYFVCWLCSRRNISRIGFQSGSQP
jgi:hypothetical protein